MRKNHLNLLFWAIAVAAIGIVFSSCNNNDDDSPKLQVYWQLYLNPQSQVPAVSGNETGVVAMQLFSDNSLDYYIKVNNLTAGDQLTMAHFHAGDPITNGPVIFDFHPTFVNGVASGTVTLRQSLVDSLLNTSNQIYFNVHSNLHPSGLVRGQVNSDIILAADVDLSGANQVPPVTTTATGKAIIRMTTEKKLYSNVSVSNLEPADALTMAHIHTGAAGTNGDILVTLCATAADFGMNKTITLTNEQISTIRTASTYVNVHSTNHATGIVRGQLVNGIANPPTNPSPY